MKKYCLTLDLKDDENLINEYVTWHKKVWDEIKESIRSSGIIDLEIYRYNNRLCMIIIADDSFSFEKKAAMDAENLRVQEWEELMWKYQQALPGSKPGEKWVLMENIFCLNN
ncbi:L-rhamnose mutarotase [Desertivirga brevis]|uniref:L-rhamnose mutarotase n=1 Tax=Desertivirga brevis TaxID=2810310 RepID=UPI001A96911F|nr:L-rhamnose mutarotase [Pedobacter sp. SYSU D00873]